MKRLWAMFWARRVMEAIDAGMVSRDDAEVLLSGGERAAGWSNGGDGVAEASTRAHVAFGVGLLLRETGRVEMAREAFGLSSGFADLAASYLANRGRDAQARVLSALATRARGMMLT